MNKTYFTNLFLPEVNDGGWGIHACFWCIENNSLSYSGPGTCVKLIWFFGQFYLISLHQCVFPLSGLDPRLWHNNGKFPAKLSFWSLLPIFHRLQWPLWRPLQLNRALEVFIQIFYLMHLVRTITHIWTYILEKLIK